jgi:4-amino-4-deoxy-L-arabinose transferase-like glycosyltransferase
MGSIPAMNAPILEDVPVQNTALRVNNLDGTPGWWFALSVVTLIALGLRCFAINSQSFWYDEAAIARLTESSYADLLRGEAKDQGNPPLYPACSKAWSDAFGRSEIGLRSLSVVCGVCAVPFLACLGSLLFNRSVGLLAAALLAISPLQIELSNENRTYAMLHLLIIVNTWLFVRWVQERRIADLILYGATAALGWYSHYYAPAVQIAQGMTLATLPHCRKLLIPWIGIMVLAALFWIPWLPSFVQQLRIPGNLVRTTGRSWVVQFIATPITFGLGRTFTWRDSPAWMHAVAALGVIMALLCPIAIGIVHNRRNHFAVVLLSGWLLVPILVPLVVAVFGRPIYHHRYASVGLPAFLLLAAAGLQSLRPSFTATLLGLLLVLTCVSLFRYAAFPLKDDWRSATHTILADLGNSEPILVDNSMEVTTFWYYASKYGHVPTTMFGLNPSQPEAGNSRNGQMFSGIRYYEGSQVDPVDLDYSNEIASSSRLWLALCLPVASADRYDSQLARLGFRLIGQYSFNRVDVYHYAR